MPTLPEPRVISEPEPFTPPGGTLTRAVRAVVSERRLPTRIETAKERLLTAIGCPLKTIEAEGFRFRVRRLAADEHFVRSVLDHFYNPPGYEIGSADVVVDVGANIGAFAVWAATKASAGRVLAVEPASENFERLTENVRLNGLTNVVPIHAALAAAPGTTTLYLANRSSGDHTTDPAQIEACRGTEEVEAITLGGLLDRYELPRCDLIKFNCEGAEFPIVLNLDDATAARIGRIVLGYHVDLRRDKRPQSDALVQRLGELGFIIDDYTDVRGTQRGTIFARRR